MKLSTGLVTCAVFLSISLTAVPANADPGEKDRGSSYFESDASEDAR